VTHPRVEQGLLALAVVSRTADLAQESGLLSPRKAATSSFGSLIIGLTFSAPCIKC
jgi:hypothetical protein